MGTLRTRTGGHTPHGHGQPQPDTRAEVAYRRAAEVGQRAGRRRGAVCATPCHFASGLLNGQAHAATVGPVTYGCLPPRLPTIRVTDEWLQRHVGLVATMSGRPDDPLLLLTLHAPEANVLYVAVDRDPFRMITVLRRVDA